MILRGERATAAIDSSVSRRLCEAYNRSRASEGCSLGRRAPARGRVLVGTRTTARRARGARSGARRVVRARAAGADAAERVADRLAGAGRRPDLDPPEAGR